jgi:hypothetical protein
MRERMVNNITIIEPGVFRLDGIQILIYPGGNTGFMYISDTPWRVLCYLHILFGRIIISTQQSSGRRLHFCLIFSAGVMPVMPVMKRDCPIGSLF